MDFILWGFIKNKVFAQKPCTVEDMIQFIIEACQEIDDDKDLYLRMCMSAFKCVHSCTPSIFDYNNV